MSLSRAFVSGTVIKAPEKRFTQNDMAMADFSIDIDPQNSTKLRIFAFGNLADTITRTIKLNDKVAVEGKLQINKFTAPDGKEKRYYEINASSVERMDSGATSVPNPINSPKEESVVSFSEPTEDLIDEDEIPF